MTYRYYLCVLAIFKNESHIMREWLQHYIAEGVDMFYLINNFSTDEYAGILQEFAHCVLLVDSVIPNEQLEDAQVMNYKSVLDNYITGQTEWLIIVDMDEFMYAKNGTISNELRKIHFMNDKVSCVSIGWKQYGSNGHISQPKSVVKNFISRIAGNVKTQIKNIFRPDTAVSVTQHSVELKPGYIQISMSGPFFIENSITMTEETAVSSLIQCNHYRLQSRDYWINTKMTRGDICTKNLEFYRTLEFFENFQSFPFIHDDALYQKHKKLYDNIDKAQSTT